MRLKQLNRYKSAGISLNGMRLNTANIVALSFIILVGFGCGEEEVVPEKEAPAKEETLTQYGEPFNNVPSTSDIAMYEVNLQAFSSSGDLKGVEARLDEIKDLGINVVWLMPIYPTGELKSVGSPYAIKNYTQVNPEFGNLEDLRSLVEEAHKRDMAVILDWVANHTAWDHPWIQNPTWYARDASGNIISPPGMGWADVAELNYGSQAMRKEMIEAMKYWVLEANVDGYRCDYAEGVPTDFWEQAIDTLRSIPDREIIMFAEAADKELFSAGFDLIFGWNFHSSLKEVFNDNASAAGLFSANANDYTNVPEGAHILRWIDNHDDNAWEDTPVNTFKGQQGALAAFVLTSYMGGVPLIYNGQEVGYQEQLSFFKGSNTKIDWTVNPEIRTAYENLMAFRNNSEAVKNGSIESYSTNDVTAFKRVSGTEEVLVIVNVRNQEVNYQVPSSLANTSWQEATTNETVTLSNSVSLEPFSYLILKK
jgi:glycosidase